MRIVYAQSLQDRRFGGAGSVQVGVTDRSDGDLSIEQSGAAALAERREALVAHRWSWLRQIHSDRVVHVRAAGDGAGAWADAAVTSVPNAVLVAHSADCVPVALVSNGGDIGIAHAGWRGLQRGVLESTLRALRSQVQAHGEPDSIVAVVGPHICTACYEFGAEAVAALAGQFGPDVVGISRMGTAALDLAAAVRAELGRLGVAEVIELRECTSCDAERYWSHRARAESGRQAMVAWIEAAL